MAINDLDQPALSTPDEAQESGRSEEGARALRRRSVLAAGAGAAAVTLTGAFAGSAAAAGATPAPVP